MAKKFTDAEIQRLRTIFQEADTDRSSSLSLEEAKKCVNNFGINVNEQTLDAAFKKFDTNNSGNLEFVEFMKFCHYAKEEELKEAEDGNAVVKERAFVKEVETDSEKVKVVSRAFGKDIETDSEKVKVVSRAFGKDIETDSDKVKKYISKQLNKDVRIPDDLLNGVVLIEIINKLSPNAIDKYDGDPKTKFAKISNFNKINKSLLKFGISPGRLPVPSLAVSGVSNGQIVGLILYLATRAAKLRVAPEAFVKALKANYKKQLHIRSILRAHHKKAAKLRIEGAIRAAKYQREYKKAREGIIKKHIKAEKLGNYYVPPEPKLAFVIRLRGINGVAPKPKKILQLFRLRQIQNGVFVKLNKATLNMLKFIEPFIAFGYPTVGTIRALLLKRGFASIRKQRIPITTNAIIDKALGKKGIHNLDDIVHELYTVGPHFTEVNRFLWPFKLTSPRGGYGKSKLRHFAEGGSAGNRQGLINKLIRQCI